MWLQVDRSTWSVLFQRKPTSERRGRGVLTKGAENKAEAIALHVAGNSFRPLKRAFLPACFSPSSMPRSWHWDIHEENTRRGVDPRTTRSDSSLHVTPSSIPRNKSLSEISCRARSFLSSYIPAFQSLHSPVVFAASRDKGSNPLRFLPLHDIPWDILYRREISVPFSFSRERKKVWHGFQPLVLGLK